MSRPVWLDRAKAWLTAKWWHPCLLVAVLTSTFGVVTVAPAAMADVDRVADMSLASTVLDRSDQPVFNIFEEFRLEVGLDEIAPCFLQALLAVEDERFYGHAGIAPTRIAAALWHDMRNAELAQGGSTITQQLARTTFLNGDKTIRRKLAEVLIALRLEWRYSKKEILQFYVNRVYFGGGLYGVEAAARGYFGKPARDLTLGEAALLAGLVKAPSTYAPTEHLPRALERRKIVLSRMVDAGFIDKRTAADTAGSPVTLREGAGPGQPFGHYFKNHVARLVVARFGWERVSQGGLRIYTTIDPAAQRSAERELVAGLQRIERLPAYTAMHRRDRRGKAAPEATADVLQGALVAIDVRTGEVRALVGGRDFDTSSFDRVTQSRRQAGSAFKPLVYAAALETGYSPATFVTGLNDEIATPQGPWTPDDGHSTGSSMTVRRALRTSSNRAAVRVAQDIGLARVLAHAGGFGVEPPPAVPSMPLGSGEVTLLSLTNAYGAFANGGFVHTPTLIRRVEDGEGRVLFRAETRRHQAVSEATAFLMADMLADVVNRGTGARARREGFTAPAAGKTGTTNDYRDAWFIGFTPTTVAGVWIGFDQPRTIMSRGYATELAVPIWAHFMQATASKSRQWLRVPDRIVAADVCLVSGYSPGVGCQAVAEVADDGTITLKSMVGREYFRIGTEPTLECPVHQMSIGR